MFIHRITNAYLLLLQIFGFIILIGSYKAVVQPDETLYTPGKLVALYQDELDTFVPGYISENTFHASALAANSFQDSLNTLDQCSAN